MYKPLFMEDFGFAHSKIQAIKYYKSLCEAFGEINLSYCGLIGNAKVLHPLWYKAEELYTPVHCIVTHSDCDNPNQNSALYANINNVHIYYFDDAFYACALNERKEHCRYRNKFHEEEYTVYVFNLSLLFEKLRVACW